jgi:hypothetical protein
MVVPLAVRLMAAVAGGLLVLAAWASVTGTLIVSRSVGGWLTRWVDRFVTGAFGLAAVCITDYRRDRLLATPQARSPCRRLRTAADRASNTPPDSRAP